MSILAVFVILPVMGAFIEYTTKWVSAQLIFTPTTFVGIGPLGWQGVVQRRSPTFAAGVAGMLDDIAPVSEIVDRAGAGAGELADAMALSLGPMLDDLTPRVIETTSAALRLWTSSDQRWQSIHQLIAPCGLASTPGEQKVI